MTEPMAHSAENDALYAKGWHEGWQAGIRDERAWGAVPNELRIAALTHAIECYGGPDDDTIPVLRHWLHNLSVVAADDAGGDL